MEFTDQEFVVSSLKRIELTPEESLRLERLGDSAFDCLAALMSAGVLRTGCQVLAMRRLALLARQFCQGRKLELLLLAERAMADRRIGVRSAALNLAVAELRILGRWPHRESPSKSPFVVPPELRGRVYAAIDSAIARGVYTAQAEYGTAFLAAQKLERR